MRLAQVTVPKGTREQVLQILEEEGLDYVVTGASSDPDYEAVVFFPIPTEAVEPILDALLDAGIDRDAHSVILSAETVVSQEFEELQDTYETDEDTDGRIALAELRAEGQELIPSRATYVLLTVASAIIATAGLLLDSPAVVVGSMVIAPLVGPALATNVGTVLFDEDLFAEGLKTQILGFVVAVLSAILFAIFAKSLFLVPPSVEVPSLEQVAGRLTPDLLSVIVAVASGVAGARSLASDIPTALVGVMIAAALVPPIAAVGIGVAWWLPGVVFNASLLVLVNGVSINLAALATLWYTGYRPLEWLDRARARNVTKRRLATMGVVILVLSAPLGIFTANAYQTASSTQQVSSEVESVLDGEPYRELTLVDVDVAYNSKLVGAQPARVSVVVRRPSGTAYPDLIPTLDRKVEDEIGRTVDMQVQYVDIDSEADGRPATPQPGAVDG